VAVWVGDVTVFAGCVTVVVGCLMLMLTELVVDGGFAALDAECALVVFCPPLPPLAASATPTPAAATAITATTTSHRFERGRRRAPQFGQDSASRATGAPQFGQKLEPGGSGADGCWDIRRPR